MSASPRAQLVEAVSGRTVPLFDEGLTAGGRGADVEIDGVDGVVAFIDPVEEGFVITDAGFGSLTVNAAPVIGQRLAQLGDRLSIGERAFWLEVAPVVEPVEQVEPVETLPAVESVETLPAVESVEALLTVEVVEALPTVEVVETPPVSLPIDEPRTPSAPRRPVSSPLRTVLGWVFVTVVVIGSAAAGYFVAAMLRGGR